MPTVSKEKNTPYLVGVEETLEEVERTAYWEASVIYNGQRMVFRLACANVIKGLLQNKPPFDKIEELRQDRTLAIEWALEYIGKGRRLIKDLWAAFRKAENVFNLKEGIMDLIPLTTLKISDGNLLKPTNSVDSLMLSMVTGSTTVVANDLRRRGTVAYPLFSAKDPLCYLLREDKIGEKGAFVFFLAVADKQSIVEYLGDESLIRLLK